MEIKLPAQGCNIVYNSYFDNYRSGTRYRYYFVDGQIVLNSSSTYSSIPSGYQCYTGKLYYKPELMIYFPFLAFALCLIAFIVIYKIILKRVLP